MLNEFHYRNAHFSRWNQYSVPSSNQLRCAQKFHSPLFKLAHPLPLFINIFRKRELTSLNEDSAFRERDFRSRLEKGKPRPSESGSMSSKYSSFWKAGGISGTGLSTNYARTGEKMKQVNTRNERHI